MDNYGATLSEIFGGGAYIFDIEANDLNATKIHCLSCIKTDGTQLLSTSDPNQMRVFFERAKVIIGHNIIRWDIPTIERLLGITISNKIVDTLPLSWYLFPNNAVHGLEAWGEHFNVPKPVINDWQNLTIEEYIHRCEEDVKINLRLLKKCTDYLRSLYDNSEAHIASIIKYLMFKMYCAMLQEKSKWKLDVEFCRASLDNLSAQKEEKMEALRQVMPKVPKMGTKTKPKVTHKQDGSLSVYGENWYNLLEESGLPDDYEGEVRYLIKMEEPNPNSHEQIKNWLYSLGWEPETFKYERNKETNDFRKIPQIKADGEICDSVKKLYKKDSNLELIEGLSVLSHRISLLKGFLRDVDSAGFLKAEVAGITNTARFRHKTIVNLPGVKKEYGEIIRGCLTVPSKDYILCGSDMSSLEDRSKQHFIYLFDPKYVRSMMVDRFDPHLDLAVFARALTVEQAERYKDLKEKDNLTKEEAKEMGKMDVVRHQYKTCNYAATYLVGAATLGRQIGISKTKAKGILDAYWKRNWSVKKFAQSCKTKQVNGQMWVFNPLSRFWYSLRYEKDIFSTVNQSAGAFCFDMWVREILRERPQLTGQFHDEVILTISRGEEKQIEQLLKTSIQKVNKMLNMNRELDVDVQFGKKYSEIH